MNWGSNSGLALTSIVVFLACAAPVENSVPEPQSPPPPPSGEVSKSTSGLGKGFLVWESNRSGRWRLWIRDLAGGNPRQLTPDEGRRLHCCPHISPDGKQIAYLSLPPDQDGYPQGGAVGTLMAIYPEHSSEPRSIVDGARNYYENRAAVWRSPTELIYIRQDGRTAKIDLDTRDYSLLTQETSDTGPWLINSNLTWAASGQGAFSPFHRDRQRVADRGPRPGCQPYFSHDGIWGFWVVAPGGPINRLHLESGTDSTMLKKSDQRMPEDRGYLYFPMLSSDGRLLAFAASSDEHEHFRADYEIFVVETDPQTLELLSEPIRFTHHEATDRFPDVYLAPLPLGRRYGEAPMSWTSAPDRNEDEWQWSYGDGATSMGSSGEHLYTKPGRYQIAARSGDTTLHGQVVVTAAGPPTLLSSSLHRNGEEIVNVFDEAIDISGLDAKLESGILVGAAELDRDNRRLRLRLAEALTTTDVLVLQGITDRALVPNPLPPTEKVIELPTWPATRDSLTLLWETGDALNLLYDAALDAETAVTMTPRGRARLDSFFRMLPAGGRFEASEGASRRVVLASKKTYEISIEMTIEPDPPQQQGAAIILTSASKSRRNFSLEQQGSQLFLTLRMKSRGEEAFPRVPLMELPSGHPAHIVVTYSPGSLRAHLDGELVLSATSIEGGFFHWRPAPLIFGSDWNGKRPWRGRLEGVAIFSRVLEDEEIHESFLRYRSKLEYRTVKSAWRARGTQTDCSAAPTLAQIDPYREALVVCHYQVQQTLAGETLPANIRVARWSMLDGRQLRLDSPGNRTAKLDLGLFGENPQLESTYLSDTLKPSVEGPLFFLDKP